MTFLKFDGVVVPGARSVRIIGAPLGLPALGEGLSQRALALGVRPEHIHLDDGGELRGTVFGTEYLGTTQIVTVTTAHGMLKARVAAEAKASPGETVGLKFASDQLSLFDAGNGRAVRTALHDGGGNG
jgi:multiple sugar transport system ATP-binding protein